MIPATQEPTPRKGQSHSADVTLQKTVWAGCRNFTGGQTFGKFSAEVHRCFPGVWKG